MMMQLPAIPSGIALLLISMFAAEAIADDKPRLILQITVDQLRGDLPTRYFDQLGDGGFATCSKPPRRP